MGRVVLPELEEEGRTTHAVWELTLACNLGCIHCGSRAGSARAHELSTSEALDLVEQLHECGIREVTLIGGEAYLRRDWLVIAAALTRAGIYCSLTTGGLGVSRRLADKMVEAGISSVSVSIDGLEREHDLQRGRPGSWQRCWETLRHVRESGMALGCNTQINRLTAPHLPELYERLLAEGVQGWQIQFTVPMGAAADHWRILLQPCELLDVFPLLARIARRSLEDGLQILPGSNVGYYGPFERLLRGRNDGSIWMGCPAGVAGLGIEADGSVKGCPSLPSAVYRGGNVRESPLREILETPPLTFNLEVDGEGSLDFLWGYCRGCDYAALCRGGCSWTAHVFFDRRGNNPYCHHRALQLHKRGLRERFEQIQAAAGEPFDHGVFRLHCESCQAPWPADDELRFTAGQIEWPASWTSWD